MLDTGVVGLSCAGLGVQSAAVVMGVLAELEKAEAAEGTVRCCWPDRPGREPEALFLRWGYFICFEIAPHCVVLAGLKLAM